MPLFNRRMILLSLLQGLSVLIVTLLLFVFVREAGRSAEEARAFAFATLIIANLGLILSNRSWSRTIWGSLHSPNPALWWVVGGATAFLTLVLTIPSLRSLFDIAPLHINDLALCLVAGAISILWFEVLKRIRGRRIQPIS